MSNLSALFGGSVKSIQAGTITIGSGASSGTATIAAVNTAKAYVAHDGVLENTSTPFGVQLVLTNGTTVTAQRDAVAFISTVSFTVVEFF